ncbi:hypothetical protein BDQ12DRAFT_655729 [Crucibulum laeve]|uniref:Rhodopsin domain-containing protein n=1 Tax=Crucibulum laeve TaxID=68775 RepID=A0A5C3LS77_9AGAR|nr:hypothetical protein BDQ12DRAFT_655729 [Crucibulum laeve]
MIPAQPYLPWKVSITILHVVAALSSVIRVEHRRRARRLWWDDYASIVPGVFECFTIAIIWLRLRHFGTFWWSRISLALAVVRITPVWSKTRLWVIGFTCAFIISWIVFVLAMTVTCAVNTAWQDLTADILICGPSSKITLATVPANVIGDMILVVFPLYRLWSIKLQPAQRHLVLFVFSTSIFTLLGSVTVAIAAYDKFFNGPGALFVWLMITNIEVSIAA